MINYGLSNIPGLVSAYDVANPKSYSGSGSTWYDLCNPTLTGPGCPFWSINIDSITISIVVEKIATSTGYATQIVSHWNGGYNNNASFNLYHFGNYTSNNQDGILCWYGNITQEANSGWANLTNGFDRMTVGNKYHIVFQHRSEVGGQLWVNGVVQGGRCAAAMLGQSILPNNNGTDSIYIAGPLSTGTERVHHIQFYNRELSDSEILLLYTSHKKRFNLS